MTESSAFQTNTQQMIKEIIEKVQELQPDIKINPASDVDITKVRALFPQAPEILFELLKQCNGTWATSFFPNSLDLLMCELIVEHCQSEELEEPIDLEALQPEDIETLDKAVKPIFFNKKHLPFASCNYDSFLLIDYDPAPTGKIGQVIYQDIESCILKVIAPSFEDLLKHYCVDLQNHLFTYDEDYCSIALASGEDWIKL